MLMRCTLHTLMTVFDSIGTNDLFKHLQDTDAADAIANDIIAMHTIAHDAGVRTVCVGIPENGPCAVPALGMGVLRTDVNKQLQEWASSAVGVVTFVRTPLCGDFPRTSIFKIACGICPFLSVSLSLSFSLSLFLMDCVCAFSVVMLNFVFKTQL